MVVVLMVMVMVAVAVEVEVGVEVVCLYTHSLAGLLACLPLTAGLNRTEQSTGRQSCPCINCMTSCYVQVVNSELVQSKRNN